MAGTLLRCVGPSAGISLSRALFRKNVGPLPNTPIFFPSKTEDLFSHHHRPVLQCHSPHFLLITVNFIDFTARLNSHKNLPVLLWGCLFVGAPVRPNMLNMPKFVSARASICHSTEAPRPTTSITDRLQF